MRTLVIGGSGLVGSNIVDISQASGIDVHATYHNNQTAHTEIQLDKTDAMRTADVLNDVDPDIVVDTAAFHSVDTCESDRDKAWRYNAAGTRNVGIAARSVDAHLIYLSTDYVFAGDPAEAPYTESDRIAPVNYYGEAKYAAEQAAKIADDVTILRPSVIYGLAAENFATWALGELEANNPIKIVDDQTSTPTYAPDIAHACIELARKRLTGLYHATGPTSLTRYEFTCRLATEFGYDTDLIRPISTEEFGQEAPRPTDSSLDSTRLHNQLDREFRAPAEAGQSMSASQTQ